MDQNNWYFMLLDDSYILVCVHLLGLLFTPNFLLSLSSSLSPRVGPFHAQTPTFGVQDDLCQMADPKPD